MIKAVIFDMDGVIIDSQKVANTLLMENCKMHGANISEEEINMLQGMDHKGFWDYVKKKCKLPESIDYYANTYDIEKEITAYPEIGPVPGVIDLMHKLKSKNLKLAIATSASRKRMEAVLSLFKINNIFEVMICSEDVKKSKPDPQIYNLTAEKLGVKNEECVVIEDSANGIKSAEKAKMKCVGYKNINSGNQDFSKTDMVIEDFSNVEVDNILGI